MLNVRDMSTERKRFLVAVLLGMTNEKSYIVSFRAKRGIWVLSFFFSFPEPVLNLFQCSCLGMQRRSALPRIGSDRTFSTTH